MNRTEHLLTILAEECAEVAQRASKALRFGLQEIQPGQGLTNAQRIGHELNDLWAVVELLGDASILALASDTAAIERKKEKVRQYMDYAKECGSLSSINDQATLDRTVRMPSGSFLHLSPSSNQEAPQ